MRKITLKLKHKDGTYRLGQKWIACRSILRTLFALPKSTTTPISLVISGKEMQNSYRVQFGEHHDCNIFYEGDWHHKALYSDADAFVHENGLSGQVVWVTLYWEE